MKYIMDMLSSLIPLLVSEAEQGIISSLSLIVWIDRMVNLQVRGVSDALVRALKSAGRRTRA